MCGIAGIYQKKQRFFDSRILTVMGNSIKSRGIDDQGFLGWSINQPVSISQDPETIINHQLMLIHRRLSILDLTEAGWQPMGTSNQQYYIIFNGEIYNYLELQKELKSLGYKFNSHSDTEVLLNAYVEWGTNCLTKLTGMFAFAILDIAKHKLFLARDFLGIKPLYYTYCNEGFAFASEITTLLQIPNMNPQINSQRAYEYLHSGVTDYGDQTLFANINQLPSAHYLEISLDNFIQSQPIRYWNINLNQTLDISYQEATAQIRELFLNNMQLHLRSDVPLGAALSGGIDSSAIVMAMRHLLGEKLQLLTFSYIASDNKINEEKWIDLINNQSQSISAKIQPNPQELINDLEHLIAIQGEPFGSTSIYAQYRIFQLAKSTGIKVMLDGQGADEILGGYRAYLGSRMASLLYNKQWYQAFNFAKKSSQLPQQTLIDLLIRTGGLMIPNQWQNLARKLVNREFDPPWLNLTWFRENCQLPSNSYSFQDHNILKQELYKATMERSLPMLLRYEDRNSMSNSIESRVPFLTPNFVQFIFSLPESYIIDKNGRSKAIFRDAMKGIVPDLILNRSDKIGFSTPEYSWLNMLRPWVESVINSDIAKTIPIFDYPFLQKDVELILNGQKKFNFQVWRWLNLIKWAEYFNVEF
jgi:asparagine synthase (glutamine-hydrolysing)